MRECQSISKTTSLVRWYTQGQPVKRCQGYGCPRLTNVHGERRLAYLVRSPRRAKAQTADIRNSGLDRKLSEHSALKFTENEAAQLQTGQSAHNDPCLLLKVSTVGT